MDVSEFLNKMSGETEPSRRRKAPQISEGKERTGGAKKASTPRPPVKPKRQRVYKEEEFDIEADETNEETMSREEKNPLNEEFLEKALDYANIVIKSVKKSFDNPQQRRKVMESIQNAISFYLGETRQYSAPPTPQQHQVVSSYQSQQRDESEQSWSNIHEEKSQNVIPGNVQMNDLTGQQVDFSQEQADYSRKINVGIKMNEDGEQEADISGLSQQDIYEMKVLAGNMGINEEKNDE